MLYNSKKTLRNRVEKKYGKPLSDYTWEMLEPEYGGPYDDYCVEDILSEIKDYKPKVRKRRASFKPILRSIKNMTRPYSMAISHSPMIRYYRKHVLGLERPIPLDNALQWLRSNIPSNKSDIFYVLCPVYKKSFSLTEKTLQGNYVIDVYRVTRTEISHEWNKETGFTSFITDFASFLRCHEAPIVSWVLCDIPVNLYYGRGSITPRATLNILVVIFGSQISIIVPNPRIPSTLISKVYNFVRKSELIIPDEPNKQIRPRSETARVMYLLYFEGKNQELSWKERFNKWNSENPHWSYRSVQSMQSAYHNALRRMNALKRDGTPRRDK